MSKRILDFAKETIEKIEIIYSQKNKTDENRKIYLLDKYPSKLDFIKARHKSIIQMLYHPKYLCPDYDGPLKWIHDNINHSAFTVFRYSCPIQYRNIEKESRISIMINDKSRIPKDQIEDIRRSMMSYISLALWLYDKQVFRFSNILLEEFVDFALNSNGEIPIEALKYLPFKSICIDLSENGIINGDDKQIEFLIVSPIFVGNDMYYVINMEYTDTRINGQFLITKFQNINHDIIHNLIGLKSFNLSDKQMNTWGYAVILSLNCLTYLVSKKPDIKGDDIPKTSYHKSTHKTKTKNNQEREIRKWECGFRYADSVKESKQHVYLGSNRKNQTSGKSKRPHVRRAHWHRYWVGKESKGEEKHLELRWINTIHINAEFISDLPIVSHKETH